ncbi:DUF4376 domain-containing protein [Orrella dioscoreae]|uniref:DUF4376 domain-containing protein n=1 Tax=Orrella dioscoreae TaxID=1851544 RepID=A0A1C3K816_9BURK|nr:DUF4376 domain-containing protein [Orrella dioscoreae]SBT27535.1 hypothetical protein ODI_02437 [Orrella dioscoreae]SOE48117.1 hypothetical protein ODI_R1245 [Orrella dioscoreae]
MTIDYSHLVTAEHKLTSARAAASALIQAWRDGEERIGVVFDHDGRMWDGDDASLARLQGAIGGGLGAVPDFFWTDHDNEDVPMDGEALDALLVAMQSARAQRGFEIHQRQRAMKEAVATMSTADLAAFTPGW